MEITLRQQGKWMPADTQTPVSLYLKLVGTKPGILLESSEVDGRLGRYSFIAWDFRLLVDCVDGKIRVKTRDERFKPLQALNGREFLPGLREILKTISIEPAKGMQSLPYATRALYGYLGYGIGGMLEPKLHPVLPPEQARTSLVLPANVILLDHLHYRCCHLCIDEKETTLRPKKLPLSRDNILGPVTTVPKKEEYMSMVDNAKEQIQAGEAIQIVLSTRFQAPFEGDHFSLYRRLRQINPSPYTFYMRMPEMTFMGSSPELMVRCEDGKVWLRPIAGTRPRGKDASEDVALAEELLSDPKERAEHVMLVDLGRNDLGRIAQGGSVKVDRFMQVEHFSHVMHLTSYLSADLRQELDHIDILRATFPAGTVSGAPKIRAMEIIGELEQAERGPYAGAIGWLGLDKDSVNMDTGIAIRSLWIEDGLAQWQAGAGIVYDSDPEKEWQECQNKARVIAETLKSPGGGDDIDSRQL
ncbi:MAG: anthranilate synthase component I family protein [Desulfovibrionales bacterium]